MNVVERRQQRVELAWPRCLLSRDLERGFRFVVAIIDAAIDRFILDAAIDADQPPREVIVNRRLRAGRDDEREQAERSIVSTIQGVLADAAAHAALAIR